MIVGGGAHCAALSAVRRLDDRCQLHRADGDLGRLIPLDAARDDGVHGGPIRPVQGCDLCNTDVTQSPWSDNCQVFG